MNHLPSSDNNELVQKLNRETSKISWRELQRFFAAGNAIYVDETLDLIQLASKFARDETKEIERLMTLNQVKVVDETMAQTWHSNNLLVWAVVVSPWVLVQLVTRK